MGGQDGGAGGVAGTCPCFVAGTPVDTPRGPVPVEMLRPGDAVCTRDGVAILRWTGIALRRAEGRDTPVRIGAGLFGATRDIAVSPEHRVLVTGPRAALLFGATEVLVPARDLVDGCRVTWAETGAPVRYVHLLFDRHEIVTTAGLASESYQPGQRTLSAFDHDARAELFRLYPEFVSVGAAGWGMPARRPLQPAEARALLAPGAVTPPRLH